MIYKDYSILFAEYITVCNQAIARNADKFPFNHILAASSQRRQNQYVDVQIAGEDHQQEFRLAIAGQKVTAVPLCQSKAQGKCCGGCRNRQWQISADYLQAVVDQPDLFIENPALINWEWLQGEEDYLSLQG